MTGWRIGRVEATFYRDGQAVLTIPARDYATLAADLVAALRSQPATPKT